MGIPGFYGAWLEKYIPNAIFTLPPGSFGLPATGTGPSVTGTTGTTGKAVTGSLSVSSLAFDLNGLLYEARSLVYDSATSNAGGGNAVKPHGFTGGAGGGSQDIDHRKILDEAQLEAMFMNTIQSLILEIVTKLQPQECLILAVDGVVPAGKLQQQRQRRFKNAKNLQHDTTHDVNALTPGTEIMIKIDKTLQSFIALYKHQLPPKIIYSSHLVPGEAEHKIMDIYRNDPSFTGKRSVISAAESATRSGDIMGTGYHIIYGMDADLIILGLLAPINNIIIARERRSKLINIEVIKKYLRSDAASNDKTATRSGTTGAVGPAAVDNNSVKRTATSSGTTGAAVDNDGVVHDFAIMMMLVGNDFLPHMPSLENIADSINLLLTLYKKTKGNFSADDSEINYANFTPFLKLLADNEASLLSSQHIEAQKGKIKYPSSFITKSIVNDTFDYRLFTNEWYSNALRSNGPQNMQMQILNIISSSNYKAKGSCEDDLSDTVFNGGGGGGSGTSGAGSKFLYTKNNTTSLRDINVAKIDIMIMNYLRTLSWVYKYYTKGPNFINTDWYYPHYHTPLIRDIVQVTANLDEIFGHKNHPGMVPFTVLHQMVAVLPKKSIKLLPIELRPLFSLDSPLLDMFFADFTIELDGKNNEHSGIAIIPFINKNRIYEAMEQIQFTKDRAILWVPEKDMILTRNINSGRNAAIIVGDPDTFRTNIFSEMRDDHSGPHGGRGGRGGARGATRGGPSRGSGGFSGPSRGGGFTGPSRGGSSQGGLTEPFQGGGGRLASKLTQPGVKIKREGLPEIDF